MIDREDQEFLSQMARQLDATIQELKEEEAKSLAGLNKERVRELNMYWNKEFDPAEMEEMRRFIDHDDRKLIWIWSRLERSHNRRALVGQSYMVMSNELMNLPSKAVDEQSGEKESD